MLIKKRELLPKLKTLIKEVVSLSEDLAALELTDSENIALRVRRKCLDIQNIHLKVIRDDVAAIRFHNKQKKLNKKPTGAMRSTDERNE